MNFGDITNGTTLVLALGSNFLWLIAFVVSSEKKKYAAERDFNHVKNNLKQMGDGIAMMEKDIDSRFDGLDKTLAEIKAYIAIHVASTVKKE